MAQERPTDQEQPSDTQALVARMREDADSERERILSDARQKREELLREADNRIEKMRDEAESRLARELQTEEDRVFGETEMKMRNDQLEVRRRRLAAAFDAVGQRLESCDRWSEYPAVLHALTEEATGELGTAEVTLTVREEDREIGLRIASALGLTGGVETSSAASAPPGTIVVATTDGFRSVDNSLTTRLHHARNQLATEVANLLFGDMDHY